MSGPTEFTIGSEVCSSDGPCGELARVVIDPVARTLTHLVVEPRRGRKKSRLVPVTLAVPTTDGVALACTTAEFEELDEAEEAQFIPGGSGQFRYGQDQMLSWPYHGLAAGGNGGARCPSGHQSTVCKWAKSRCAGGSMCSPPTALSGGYGDWSSIVATIV